MKGIIIHKTGFKVMNSELGQVEVTINAPYDLKSIHDNR